MSPGGLQATGKPGPGLLDLQPIELQWASQVVQQKRTRLLVQETQVRSWGRKVHWDRKWQPVPSILALKIPRTKEPGGLSSMGSQRVGHDGAHVRTRAHTHTHTHTDSKTTRHLTFHRNQMVDVFTGIILMWLKLGFVKYRLTCSKYLRLTQSKINFVSYIFI